jgi:hypothetical protein
VPVTAPELVSKPCLRSAAFLTQPHQSCTKTDI